MKKIRIKDILSQGHNMMNDVVMDTAGVLEDAYLISKIDDLVKERGITQKDLAQMTGMRVGTISDLVNGKGTSINKVQLFSVMVALRVTSISDIYELRLPEDLHTEFVDTSKEWTETREMPMNVKEMYRNNVLKASGLK